MTRWICVCGSVEANQRGEERGKRGKIAGRLLLLVVVLNG